MSENVDCASNAIQNAEKMEPSSSPPPILRQDLIEKAVNFLQDPKVNQTPVNYQKAFLVKKGLTEAEIEESFKKVGNRAPVVPAVQNVPQYVNYPPPPPIRSRWSDYASVLVLAGGATYLTANFVKNYVLPRFFGVPTAEQQQLNVIHENLSDVQNGLKFLVDSCQQTLTLVQQQQDISNKLLQQLSAREDSTRSLEKAVVELKNEISIVKSLLLSRDQFPPLPQTKTPSLPAWQQINGSIETPKKQKIEQNGDADFVSTEGSPV